MQVNPDSRIQENFTCGIRNRELWNPESRFHLQRLDLPVTGIRNPWHGIQNSRLSWIPLHGATLVIGHLHIAVILLLQAESFRVLLSCAN